MSPTSITAWLNDFSKRRNLPHINPHAFRHSVASILISAGTDIVTVSKQLGHSQVSTAGGIYSHVIEQAKALATETIADIMLRRKNASKNDGTQQRQSCEYRLFFVRQAQKSVFMR